MAGIVVKKLNENLAKNAVGQYLQEGLKQQRNLKFNMIKNNVQEAQQPLIQVKEFNLKPQKAVNQYLENARKEQRKYIQKIKNLEKIFYPNVVTDFKPSDLSALPNNYFMPNNLNKDFLEYVAENILTDTPNKSNEKIKFSTENTKQNKEDFNLLTKNIKNKILIANIILILTFGTLVHLDTNYSDINITDDEELIKNLLLPKKSQPEIIVNEENINSLKDKFYEVIEKIKSFNISLYNSLKNNFNRIISLPEISYNYIKSILENINKIRDINLYKKALNNFNLLCINIIIVSSETTKNLISSFKNIITNYISLTSSKIGNIAKNNFNIFLRLFSLPNINKQELLNSFINYIKSLRPQIIIIKLKELAKLIKENHFKNLKVKQTVMYHPNNIEDTIEEEYPEYQRSITQYIKLNKEAENSSVELNKNLKEKESQAKDGFYNYVSSLFSKNEIKNDKETKKAVYDYLKDYFNTEDFLFDQIKKTEKLKTNSKIKNLVNDLSNEKNPNKILPDILKENDKKLFENKQIFDDLLYLNTQLSKKI